MPFHMLCWLFLVLLFVFHFKTLTTIGVLNLQWLFVLRRFLYHYVMEGMGRRLYPGAHPGAADPCKAGPQPLRQGPRMPCLLLASHLLNQSKVIGPGVVT